MLSRFNFHHEVRKRLDAGARLVLTDHAKIRMAERDITIEDVLQCIRQGHPTDHPIPDTHRQSTTCRLGLHKEGVELAVVVAIPDQDPGVVVITVYGNEP